MKIMCIFLSLFGILLIVTSLSLFFWKPEFLNQSTNLEWFIYPPLFDLRLNNFITLFLNRLLGLLVQVLLLIFGMINGVPLLLYQSLEGYLMVLEYHIQFLNFGLIVIGLFPCHYDRCLSFLNISWLGRNMIFLIKFWKILGVSFLSRLGLFSWILEFPMTGVNSFGLHIYTSFHNSSYLESFSWATTYKSTHSI